jgi:hypothetical protein
MKKVKDMTVNVKIREKIVEIIGKILSKENIETNIKVAANM